MVFVFYCFEQKCENLFELAELFQGMGGGFVKIYYIFIKIRENLKIVIKN